MLELLKGKDIWWGILTVIMLLALIGFGIYSQVTERNLDNASLVVGGLMTNLGLLLNFRYGSSKGSKEKTELLNSKTETK